MIIITIILSLLLSLVLVHYVYSCEKKQPFSYSLPFQNFYIYL